jgi:alpha/beta superfamily hydrolase
MQAIDYMVPVDSQVVIQAKVFLPEKNSSKSEICVVSHPYSQWGGTMENNVVVGVVNYLVHQDFPCISFNFRGVGKSTGTMGDGTEEQKDIQAICDYCVSKLGYQSLNIIGYSYGGLISLAAVHSLQNIKAMVLISYPHGFTPHLGPIYDITFPLLFIHGNMDNIIPPSRVKHILANFKQVPKYEEIGSDHFHNGKEKQIAGIITEFLESL